MPLSSLFQPPKKPWGLLGYNLSVFALYWLTAKGGLALATVHGSVSPVWPASGLAIASCVLGGYRLLPGIFLGALVANLNDSLPSWVSLSIALGNSLEAGLGAWIISLARRKFAETSLYKDALGYTATALFAPLSSVLFGVGPLLLSRQVPLEKAPVLSLTWWSGDCLGALLCAPLILHLVPLDYKRPEKPGKTLLQISILCLLGLLICWLAFLQTHSGAFLLSLFPLLIICTGWFGTTGARLASFLIASIGVLATSRGLGPFSGGVLNEDLLLLQAFLFSIGVAGLLLPLMRSLGDLRLPSLVLLIGWLLSSGLLTTMNRNAESRDLARFQNLITKAQLEIEQRMESYENVLNGCAALLRTHPDTSRREWADYVAALELTHRYPGIQGLGIVRVVRPDQAQAFIEEQRQSGAPDFLIKPVPGHTTPTGHDLFVVTYKEPFELNNQALGLDLASEPVRRKATNLVRDTGLAHTTGRIALVQDDRQGPGMILYIPLYKTTPPPASIEQRRKSLWAFVSAPFIVDKVLDAVIKPMGNELELDLYQSDTERPSQLLYRSLHSTSAAPSHEADTWIELLGQRYKAHWSRGPQYSNSSDRSLGLTAAGMALITLLATGLIFTLQTVGLQARRIAEDRTRQLHLTQEKLSSLSRMQGAVLDGTPYSIIATDQRGLIEIFNAGAERMLGYSREEMVNKQSPAILHLYEEVAARAAEVGETLQKDLKPGFESIVALTRVGLVDEREWTYVRKDGTRLPVLLSITALLDNEGHTTGFMGIAHDLTKQKEIEAKARESEARFTSIFETVNDGIVLQDTTGLILECNEASERILGLSHAQMTGRDSMDPRWRSVHEDGSPFRGENHPAMVTLRTGKAEHNVIMGVHKPDNSLTWISISSQALHDEAGAIRSVVCSFVDITERKLKEEQLRASMQEVINLRTALDEHAIVAITDLDGAITYVNERFCSITGYARQEALGKDHRIINSGLHTREFFDTMWRTILSGRVWHGEVCNRNKQGYLYWVETTIVPIPDAQGKPVQFISIRTDITARHRLEEDLAKARDQAISASRLKSEFLANMSHEIRTPMNGVIGMTALLLNTKLDQTQQHYAQTVRASGQSLLTVINDILDFSKIEAGKLDLECIDFNLLDLIDSYVTPPALKARKKGLEFSCVIEPTIPLHHRGDPVRLVQVLTNLTENALKFTSLGEVSIHVGLVSEDKDSSLLRFSVRDTGVGIPTQKQGQLFQSFTQVDASTTRRFGGTGLGLAISKQLATLMGGSIGLNSHEGKGSEFWFTIRLLKPTRLHEPENPPAQILGKRILLLLPQQTSRESLRSQLAHWGASVGSASDTSDACRLLSKSKDLSTPYDLLVLDSDQKETGKEAFANLLATAARSPDLAILQLRGLEQAPPEASQPEASFFHLTKPVSRRALATVLNSALDKETRPARETAEEGSKKPQRPSQDHVRILLAEDNPVNQMVAAGLLHNLGYPNVDCVDNGLAALEALASRRYTLVLMDVQMPGMDGFEATRRIRDPLTDVTSHSLPIIALTANAIQGDEQKCLEVGMNDYIPKPIDPEKLDAVVARWVG